MGKQLYSVLLLSILLGTCWLIEAVPVVPPLPGSFLEFTEDEGVSLMQTAGATSGVYGGQVEGILNLPVAGAINRVLPHPKNADILYVGAVNGGVWKTVNARAAQPTWQPLTDHLSSLSIGAMAFDYSDPSLNTIVVALGSQSSFSRLGGYQLGVMRTTDGGATWNTQLGLSTLYGYRLAGIATYGSNIVTCAVGWGYLSSQLYKNGGTFISKDNGTTWQQIDFEPCTDLIVDPSHPTTFYKASLQNGIVYSTDAGLSWAKSWPGDKPVFSETFNETLYNIRIAVHTFTQLPNSPTYFYAGFLSKTLQGLYQAVITKNSNSNNLLDWTWTLLDTPQTNDNGTINGLNPTFENNPGEGEDGGDDDDDDDNVAGGQGMVHFSIAADPVTPGIVYVGGDRQPTGGNATDPSWPNSIGAYNYDGRLFRCNSGASSGSQCLALTHMYALNNSAPHADSRNMLFDAEGSLIESDDGGVYKRTNPSSTNGQWFSLNGNILVQEAQVVAYLGNNTFATGNQDTGTTMGVGGSGVAWQSLGQGDGAVTRSAYDVSRDTWKLYWSYPYFGGFSVSEVDSHSQTVLSTLTPNMSIAGTNNSLNKWVFGPKPPVAFYQNYAVNTYNTQRLFFVFDFDGFAYESFDGGFTLQPVNIAKMDGQSGGSGAVVYGGKVNGQTYENLAYVAGLNVLAKRNVTGNFKLTTWPPIGIRWPTIADVAVDASDFNLVGVLTIYGELAFSMDAGETWQVLPSIQVGVAGTADAMQRKLVIVPSMSGPRFLVAGRAGLFVLQQEAGTWWRIAAWPNAYINDMGYHEADDLVYVSTLGRGVWKLPQVSSQFTSSAFKRNSHDQPHPIKVPNWQLATYVFAALTVLLFLSSVVLGVAYMTSRSSSSSSDASLPLVNDPE